MQQQQPFSFALPQVSWRPPELSSLPSWRDAKRVGFDVETRDEDLRELGPGCRRDPRTNYVVGFSFAIEDGPAYYLPFGHDGGDNLDRASCLQYLKDQLRDFSGELHCANAEYDLDWTANDVPEILKKRVIDCQVTDVLINELQDDYDLDSLCARWDLPGKDEDVLRQAAAAYGIRDVKAELWRLPGRYVADYAIADSRRVLQIARRQERVVDADGLRQICELEWAFTPVTVKMRRRGVRIDMDRVGEIERWTLREEGELLRRVKVATGVTINVGDVWRAEVLAHALRQAGSPPPVTEAGNPSIEAEWLEREAGEIGEWLSSAREVNKIRTTYCAQMRRFGIQRGGDWFVHPTTNQVRSTAEVDARGRKKGKGVRYGRTSCDRPSVQNQPVRSDTPTPFANRRTSKPMKLGELWRSVFCARRGARWGCSDWSQQEPRIGVHYAEKLGLPGAKEFADEYRRNPALDVHQKLADLTSIARKIVKNYVNGLLYGMGDVKLCGHIGQPVEWRKVRGEMRLVPSDAARAIIDQFEAFAPWLRGLTREASGIARKRGCVWTILRRRCNFPKKPGTNEYDYLHKAFNRVGQGSAADQMKATAVAADRAGIDVDLIVHDEFDYSWTDVRTCRDLRDLQLTTVKFNVPMKVDVEVGDESDHSNWGEMSELEFN